MTLTIQNNMKAGILSHSARDTGDAVAFHNVCVSVIMSPAGRDHLPEKTKRNEKRNEMKRSYDRFNDRSLSVGRPYIDANYVREIPKPEGTLQKPSNQKKKSNLLAVPPLRITMSSLLAAPPVVLQPLLAVVDTHVPPRSLRVGENKEPVALLCPGRASILAPSLLLVGSVPAGQVLLACFIDDGESPLVVPRPLNAALETFVVVGALL